MRCASLSALHESRASRVVRVRLGLLLLGCGPTAAARAGMVCLWRSWDSSLCEKQSLRRIHRAQKGEPTGFLLAAGAAESLTEAALCACPAVPPQLSQCETSYRRREVWCGKCTVILHGHKVQHVAHARAAQQQRYTIPIQRPLSVPSP